MNSREVRNAMAILLAVLMLHLPVLGSNTVVGKALTRTGTSWLNGTKLAMETTVFSGDSLSTEAGGVSLIQLPMGDQVHVGPLTKLSVREDSGRVMVSLDHGMTIVRSGNAHEILVGALGLMVEPRGAALYTATIQDGSLLVSSDEGNVEVRGSNQSYLVSSGKAMKFEVATATDPGTTGVGSNSLTPGEAVVIAIIPGAVVGTIGWIRAEQAKDDAHDGCVAAIQAVSPSAPTTGCP